MENTKIGKPTKVLIPRGQDPTGNGWFGASRRGHKHEGTDYCTKVGEDIYAPVEGVVRIGYPYYGKTQMKLVEIKGKEYWVKVMYVEPEVKTGQVVTRGQVIGKAQDIAGYHRSANMKNHIHLEVRKAGLSPMNPELVVEK